MEISIEPLACGSLTAPLSMFEVGANNAATTLPVPAWLIRHAHGLALVDCGMHAELTRPGPLLDTVSLFFGLDLPESALVAEQLRARNVDPADIDVVILTHLHFDHVGGLHQIPNARVVVHADEWRAGFDDELVAGGTFRPEDYDLGHEVVTVDGEHDVFGDGRLTCIPTPGHTPGHQSVRIRLADSEVVLCGDCAYFSRTLEGAPLPPLIHDAAQQSASIDLLRGLGRGRGGRAGAKLIPGHDATVLETLPPRLT